MIRAFTKVIERRHNCFIQAVVSNQEDLLKEFQGKLLNVLFLDMDDGVNKPTEIICSKYPSISVYVTSFRDDFFADTTSNIRYKRLFLKADFYCNPNQGFDKDQLEIDKNPFTRIINDVLESKKFELASPTIKELKRNI